MSANRRLLALAAGILAAVVLFFALGRGRRAKPAAPAPEAGNGSAAGSAPLRGTARDPAGPTTPRTPATPTSASASDDGDAGVAETRTYVMDDGTVVRDHRRGGGEPPVATTPVPPAQRTLDPTISAKVYQQLSPKVAACARDVPATARGADPFVYVNLTVAISGGVLTATDVLPVAHDVDAAAAGGLVTCVREGLAGLRADAPGEPDQPQYVLQYPIRIR